MSPVDRVVLAFVSTRGSLYQFAGAVNRLFEMAESSRVRLTNAVVRTSTFGAGLCAS
jgi:hypothetical protein